MGMCILGDDHTRAWAGYTQERGHVEAPLDPRLPAIPRMMM